MEPIQNITKREFLALPALGMQRFDFDIKKESKSLLLLERASHKEILEWVHKLESN